MILSWVVSVHDCRDVTPVQRAPVISRESRLWIEKHCTPHGWDWGIQISLSCGHAVNTRRQLTASIHKQDAVAHWGRVTHICVGKLSIIGSDNGLSPSRRQAIIWTNSGILLIGTLGTNLIEISIEIYTFSFKKMRLKMSSGKWRPCCLGLNVLMVRFHTLYMKENILL